MGSHSQSNGLPSDPYGTQQRMPLWGPPKGYTPSLAPKRKFAPMTIATFLIGAAIAGVFLLWPIHESILGTSYNCGPSFEAQSVRNLDATNPFSASIATQCQNDGRRQIGIAIVIGVVTLIATVVVDRSVGRTRSPGPIVQAAGWYPDPYMPGGLRYFDGAAWTASSTPPVSS